MATPIQASVCQHREKNIIAVRFPKDKELIQRFRKLPGATWSSTLKSWYLPDTADYRKRFGIAEKSPVGKAVLTKIGEVNMPAFQQMEQLLILKNYSISTRRTYLLEFAQLLYTLAEYPVQNLSYERLRNYFAWCLAEQKISANQLHSRINAVKFYFEQVQKRENFGYEIPRPKKPLILPKVLGKMQL